MLWEMNSRLLFTLMLSSTSGGSVTNRGRGHHFARASVDNGNNVRTQKRALDNKLDDKLAALLDVR